MTHQLDVARGRDVVVRWCALAEQRLEYLTELFESGRWRRFHSELDFLENIQEARTAVETWRDLSSREAFRDNTAIDMSWLSRPRTALPRGEWSPVHIRRPQPQPLPVEPPRSVISIVPQADPPRPAEAPAAAVPDDGWEGTRDIVAAITDRYPLLRNTL